MVDTAPVSWHLQRHKPPNRPTWKTSSSCVRPTRIDDERSHVFLRAVHAPAHAIGTNEQAAVKRNEPRHDGESTWRASRRIP
jgi:hypothetical protein